MLIPLMVLYRASSRGSEGTLVTRKLLLPDVGVHVALEVVVRGGSVGTVGAREWLLAGVSVHVSLKVSDKVAGVEAVRTLMDLPDAMILA